MKAIIRLVTQSAFNPSKVEMQAALKAVREVMSAAKYVSTKLMNEQDVSNTSKDLDEVIRLCEEAKVIVGRLNK
jgi:hypothetical protein